MIKKNVAICVILTIITCGLYSLYWVATLQDSITIITEDNDTFKLMPTINHYQGKIVAEEEKNNQLNLFEGDYNV